jgi:hypothetical protein
MLLNLLICEGKLVFAILMAWFVGEFVLHLVYFVSFAFMLHFLSYSPNLPIASLVILACIWMIMPVIVLGCLEMRCETLFLDHAR